MSGIVKPLDWHKHGREDIERYSCDPEFAQYIITWTASGYDLFIGFWGSAAVPRPAPFTTVEAAKAAAFKDYSDRIASALGPSYASSQAEIERLRTLAERYESALKRIRDATPLNTNSADAANMCNWTYAVSSTALIDASLSGGKE